MKNLNISWKIVTSEGFWICVIMGILPFGGMSFASFSNPVQTLDTVLFGCFSGLIAAAFLILSVWMNYRWFKSDLKTKK